VQKKIAPYRFMLIHAAFSFVLREQALTAGLACQPAGSAHDSTIGNSACK
jgi:hypothetical protein